MASGNDRLGTFSQRSLAALAALGWNPGTESDIQEFENFLAELSENDFAINDVAREILGLFAGQVFNLPRGGIAWISFTATEALRNFAADYLPVLEVLIEETAPCPVAGGGGYILFACPSGKVALLQDEWFYLLVADSFADALEAILFRDRTRCREVPNVEDCRPDW